MTKRARMKPKNRFAVSQILNSLSLSSEKPTPLHLDVQIASENFQKHGKKVAESLG